jgi:hypothetical protein
LMQTPHPSWPPHANEPNATGVDALSETWDGEAPAQIRPDEATTEPLARVQLPATFPLMRRRPRLSQGDDAVSEWDSFAVLLLGAAVVCVIVATLAVVLLVQLRGVTNAKGSTEPLSLHRQPALTATPTPSPTATLTSTNGAAFTAVDATTHGNWQGVYGGTGYSLVADAQQLPGTIQLTPSGQTEFTWAASSTDPRALEKASTPGDRIAACWVSATAFAIDINVTDGQPHQLALYLLDWDQLNRVETVTVLDATTKAVLDARSVGAFSNGEYLVWQVRGHVVVQVTNAPGSVNAVVSAVFFA